VDLKCTQCGDVVPAETGEREDFSWPVPGWVFRCGPCVLRHQQRTAQFVRSRIRPATAVELATVMAACGLSGAPVDVFWCQEAVGLADGLTSNFSALSASEPDPATTSYIG
jgi:hypothetical protein